MSALDDVIQYHADNCQSGTECDLSALSRVELERIRDGISDMKAALQREIDAERMRGDTYRRRALALREQARLWRCTSEYNLEEARFYLEKFNALVSADEA